METKRGFTALAGSTPVPSAMTKDEAIEKFPVGSVVYLASHKDQLMTVSRQSSADDDDTIIVEFLWFDDEHTLHKGRAFPEALRVRVKTPPE